MTNTDTSKGTHSIDQPSCSNTSCCPPKGTTIRNSQKIGRNEPCPCGSEQKFKKCCGKNT